MRLTVLDGYTLNPGDLSWAELEKLGPCSIYDRTPAEQVVSRAENAEIVLVNKVPLARKTQMALPKLKYIGVLATGYNIVDIVAARERNIIVTNVPGYGPRSVAQMAIAHLLNFTQHVAAHGASVAAGNWSRSVDWCYWEHPLVELAGLTLGIVGLGQIGRVVAGIAAAFGMNVIAHDPSLMAQGGQTQGGQVLFSSDEISAQVNFPPKNGPLPELRVRMVPLETLFRLSDVVSLHCPLTQQTQHLVNAESLAWMKPSAFLINTSRGPLIEETALAEALNAGRIAGAGLDVLSSEPPPPDHPLFSAKNCCITPHIAWATLAARRRLLDVAVENVRAFLRGKPQNEVV